MRAESTKTGKLYEITMRGHLALHRLQAFESLSVTLKASGETVIAARIADQAALYGLLIRIRDLGVSLLSVRCIQCEDTVVDLPANRCWSEENKKGKG
jgi:hypothetical protein